MIHPLVELTDVSVLFPVHNSQSVSLKNRLLNIVTAGRTRGAFSHASVVNSLSNINLRFAPGDRVGLIGGNGAGKTTLLRVVSGIYQPTSGAARIEGNCQSLINIGLGIDPDATGRENIILRGVMMGLTPRLIREKVDDIIYFSGLSEYIDRPFRTYSSGMQLRLAFAVSTTIDPEILVMDEWLSTGDEDFKIRASTRLQELVDRAKILVIASHSRELLENNCNRVVWLESGKVKMDGNAATVLGRYFK